MPILVKWYDDSRQIALWEFEGQWQWRDYHAAINTAVVLLKTVENTVDSIIDLSRNESLPPDMLIHGPRWFRVAPANFGVTVVAGGGSLIQNVALTIGRLYKPFGEKILVADDVETAYKLLQKRRSMSGEE
ncbi:MAG: hypothetical protein K8L97_34080 [Anaerolineae bacterium]|nr:hypothetical protein [Anaerolineae bacterium]